MYICHSCGKQVNGTKKFNWIAFLLWNLTILGGITYLIYYFVFKKRKCELCGSKIK
nr:MAG TPA: LITAF-like protein [Caudoviricetes sp.]